MVEQQDKLELEVIDLKYIDIIDQKGMETTDTKTVTRLFRCRGESYKIFISFHNKRAHVDFGQGGSPFDMTS